MGILALCFTSIGAWASLTDTSKNPMDQDSGGFLVAAILLFFVGVFYAFLADE